MSDSEDDEPPSAAARTAAARSTLRGLASSRGTDILGTVVDLSGLRFLGDDVELLLAALPLRSGTERLSVANNLLSRRWDTTEMVPSDDGGLLLAQAIAKSESLTEIDIRGNDFTVAVGRALSCVYRDVTGTAELERPNPQYATVCGIPIRRLLMDKMRAVDLRGANLGPADGVILGGALVRCASVQRLVLAGNGELGSHVDGMASLCSQLGKQRSLTLLDLTAAGVNDDTVGSLADCLRVNLHLQHICLGFNAIGSDGMVLLASGLKYNRKIARLVLRGNPLGPEGAVTLAGLISANVSLSSARRRNIQH